MNTQTFTTANRAVAIIGLVTLSFFSFAMITNAATYAYVDTTGEVKPVVADTWQQAIAKAIGIHIHSGVILLDSPADFDIVGNEVSVK